MLYFPAHGIRRSQPCEQVFNFPSFLLPLIEQETTSLLEAKHARQIAQTNHSIEASTPSPAPSPLAPGMVEVHVEMASEVDQALTEAVAQVTIAATSNRIGILITRIDAGRYIVRAHPQVPFGLTRQRHC